MECFRKTLLLFGKNDDIVGPNESFYLHTAERLAGDAVKRESEDSASRGGWHSPPFGEHAR
jgi:hypothetical protein